MTNSDALLNAPFVVTLYFFSRIFLMGQLLIFYCVYPAIIPGGKIHFKQIRELVEESSQRIF